MEIVLGPASAGLRLVSELAVHVVRGSNLFIPPLVGAANLFA